MITTVCIYDSPSQDRIFSLDRPDGAERYLNPFTAFRSAPGIGAEGMIYAHQLRYRGAALAVEGAESRCERHLRSVAGLSGEVSMTYGHQIENVRP